MSARRSGRVWIGTSGWHYPHWVGPFYPDGTRAADMLGWYATCFPTVEVNNTFYRLPPAATFRAWRDAVPRGFVFACKASRYLTHLKKLNVPRRSVSMFFRRADVLGDRLGPVLFQLPPRWHRNAERLRAFLKALPAGHRMAFEFRDESWLAPEVFDLLAAHDAACCAWEFAGRTPDVPLTAGSPTSACTDRPARTRGGTAIGSSGSGPIGSPGGAPAGATSTATSTTTSGAMRRTMRCG